MSKIGWPVAMVIVVATLVVGGLAGALIASGDGNGDGEKTVVTVPETATSPPAEQPPAQQTTTDITVDSDDAPLGPAETKRVGAAAVAAVGGGTAIEVDRSDDPGEAYEVEVMTDRGEIDVALDENLRRVDNVPYDD
ncbi:MAG TPA: hypothetical protein VFH44_02665 [Solirubrobacterales bacterium]|nr:hypothetical protein [Solirubrobacterales bacterium]